MADVRGWSVVMGVGNRLRGDDAVGSLVVDELGEMDRVRVFDCSTTPENFIGPVAELEPERVLIVDACAFGGRPGEFELFGQEDFERLAAGFLSTHTLPLTMTVELLAASVPARFELLGVQPERIAFGEGLSEPVAAALPELVRFIRRWAGQSD